MALGEVKNFYENQPFRGFENLSRQQSGQSLEYGSQAARYADPWMEERKKYMPQIERLVSSPGAMESSPFYQYLRDTQMNEVKASNAATGNRLSGRGLMALQDRAAGVASQAYPLLFDQYARLSGLNQSSPAAAGLSYARGAERSQDYAQLAQAAKGLGAQQKRQAQPSAPTYYAPPTTAAATASGTGLPYSGYNDAMYSGRPIDSPGQAGYINTANGLMRYMPSSQAGTGYVSSDYGSTVFGPQDDYYAQGNLDWSGFDPAAYAEQDYWGY